MSNFHIRLKMCDTEGNKSLLNRVGGVCSWVAWVALVRGCVCGAGDVDGVG